MFDLILLRTLAFGFAVLALMCCACAVASLCEGSLKCLGFLALVYAFCATSHVFAFEARRASRRREVDRG